MTTEIERIRDEMRRSIRNYLYLPNPPDYNLLLNQFAGAGKSTIVAEELDYTDSLFIYLVNNHKIGGEQINNHRALYDLLQIESRKRLCRHRDYVKLAEHGINIKHFCPDCPYMNVCEYYQRILEIWNEPQSWIGVHHHLGGLANAYATENDIDAVVLDENFIQSIYKEVKYGYNLLVKTMNLFDGMRDCREKTLLSDFLNESAFALQNNKINNEFLYSQIYSYYRHGGSDVLLLDYADEYEVRLGELFLNKRKIFRNIITPITETLIDINDHYVNVSEPNYLRYMNNVVRAIKGKNYRYIDIARYNLNALRFNCKVLILDATTPQTFYQSIFSRQIKVLEKQIRINSKVFQLHSAKFVMQTLDKNKNTRERLVNLVRLIAEKHNEPILVLSRAKYENEIKQQNPEFIVTDHYPIVGSNDYEKMNIVVIFGTPEPKRDVLERQSVLLNYDKEKLLYIMRELYIIQGIHRIRVSLKPDIQTYVYLLTNLPLPLRHVKKMSIGIMEKMLSNEIKFYHTDSVEDRIREDILSVLETGDYTMSDVIHKVKGARPIIGIVLNELISENMINTYKKQSEKGRKPTFCTIKDI